LFRLYSKGCEYAIRVLTHVASTKGTERFQASDVCGDVEIPEPYTRKILQSLVRGKFLHAVRGPGGGYEMKTHPSEITLLEVIRAVDGAETFEECLLGLPQCGCENPCPLHSVWASEKERLLAALGSVTLQEVARTAPGGGERGP